MNTALYNSIVSKYKHDDIEKILFLCFLNNQNLTYKDSTILEEYFESYNTNNRLYEEIKSVDCSTINDLENCLELLIPQDDRKTNGAFFTPPYIVNFIINELSPKEKDKNIDPSCGCGAFLLGLIRYYQKTYNKKIKDIIRENIFGTDILEYNIRRAKLLISIYALQNGEKICEDDFNLFTRDSIRYNWTEKYDNVMGNPPYVKFQDLSDDNRDYLLNNYKSIEKGTFNLYFAFFELGYKILNNGGALGYITPNNYFTSLAGESLRKYFQNEKCVSKIIDFCSKKVFDVQTYTALTFMNKKKNDFLYYDRIQNELDPESFLGRINFSKNFYSNLNLKKWRLLKSDEQENIKNIESIGTPIGQLFDICAGIATLKDDVFFVDGLKEQDNYYIKTTVKGTFRIEKEITRPVYKISDFKTQKELELNTRRIICPYQFTNYSAKVIDENRFKKLYPRCYEYLLSEKDSLLSRDKGKVKYTPFYVWGRTQGLNRFGKKILNPTFSLSPRFLKTEEEIAFFTNGYGIFFKKNQSMSLFDIQNPISKEDNIDAVIKILNSSIMDYYITKTSVMIEGGYPCYQKNFIEKFSIPNFTNEELLKLNQISDKKEIDAFLEAKYHLNLSKPNLWL